MQTADVPRISVYIFKLYDRYYVTIAGHKIHYVHKLLNIEKRKTKKYASRRGVRRNARNNEIVHAGILRARIVLGILYNIICTVKPKRLRANRVHALLKQFAPTMCLYYIQQLYYMYK